MVFETQQLAGDVAPVPGTEPVRHKVRLRFRKGGDLRLVSHHDLMTCFERMLRRAALPFHSTQGFHPKPRLVFALSLALGIVGCEEVAELELDANVAPEEVRARLAEQAPPGLEILSVKTIAPRLRAQVRSTTYRLSYAPSYLANPGSVEPALSFSDLSQRAADLFASTECWVERLRPHKRRFDLRPFLRAVRVLPDALEIDLWVTPTGGARPDEVVRLLGLAELLDTGPFFERTRMEITDETQASGIPIPDMEVAAMTRLNARPSARESEDDAVPLSAEPPARRRVSTSPLTSGPMSFES